MNGDVVIALELPASDGIGPGLLAACRMANVVIVTSLHDGMNLVAKEFVAARDDDRGFLLPDAPGAEVAVAAIPKPAVETELCFTVGERIAGAGLSAAAMSSTQSAPMIRASHTSRADTVKSLRSTGSEHAARAACRSATEPPKCSTSVSTLRQLAPPDS